MKIALYQPWIYLHGGLEKSLLELVTRSSHEWVVYTGHYEPENTFKEFENVDVRVLNPTTVKRTIGGTLYSAYQATTQVIPDEDFDAIVVWCDGIGDLITFRNHDLPIFNICSTPLRAAFDPVYEEMSLKGKGFVYALLYKAFKHTFKFFDRWAWSYYDGIITTSTEVKNRIINGQLCEDESKMRMAYPGIEWHVDISQVTYEPFILLPGRIMWTKNIEQGIKAFVMAQLPKPWKLVVAGYVDAKSQVYLDKLKAMVPKNVNVEFVISPSSEQLIELYKRASFCLFTPLNEDWGIVPLESMRYGKAVIANARGGPLESVLPNKTGFLHEPEDFDGWASSIRKLALDDALCLAMGQHANFHVRNFTWQRFTKRVDHYLGRWVKRKKRAKKLALRKATSRTKEKSFVY
jgi:glycosyltransferase involved in cell wall biosynthesis